MNISNTSKICQWCFKPLIKKHPVIYCNKKCQSNYQYMNNFLDWYIGNNNNISNRMIRKHIETIFGHKCSNCQITEWNNKPIVFEVEHKDGNANNNDYSNLSLLCPNCHSQTPTYKGRNIGNGKRIKRNERYKQGKSY